MKFLDEIKINIRISMMVESFIGWLKYSFALCANDSFGYPDALAHTMYLYCFQ